MITLAGSTGRKLDPNPVGLGFILPRMRKIEGNVQQGLGELLPELTDPEDRGAQLNTKGFHSPL